VSENGKRRGFQTKAFTSLLLGAAFLVMLFTGAILYFTPKGQVAHWTNWTMLGLSKEHWSGVHINTSILFVIVALVHLWFNWGMFWGYIKRKGAAALNLKWELGLAVLIGAVFVAGTLGNVQPFRQVIAWNDQIKMYWARRAPKAPVPHAEQLTLERFAGYLDLPVDGVVEALRAEGFTVEDTTVRVEELAVKKGIPPSDVMAALQKHYPEVGKRGGPGRGNKG
jgi:hypothetical protein